MFIKPIQAQSDSVTCIENKKLDFFITRYLRERNLEVDTLIDGQQLRTCEVINQQKDAQIEDLNSAMVLKDTIILKEKSAVLDLDKKYIKSEKKVKVFRNTTIIFIALSILLSTIVFVK